MSESERNRDVRKKKKIHKKKIQEYVIAIN